MDSNHVFPLTLAFTHCYFYLHFHILDHAYLDIDSLLKAFQMTEYFAM